MTILANAGDFSGVFAVIAGMAGGFVLLCLAASAVGAWRAARRAAADALTCATCGEREDVEDHGDYLYCWRCGSSVQQHDGHEPAGPHARDET